VEARGVDLLLDQVEVVDEPLRRRRDLAAAPHRIADEAVRVAQRDLVLAEAGEQAVVAARRDRLVPAGERTCVALELRDIEQFRADRRGLEGLQLRLL